jgi:hypothetical protein
VNPSVPPPGFVPPPDAARPVAPAPAAPPVAPRSRRPLPRRLIAAGLGIAAAGLAAFVLLGNSGADPIAQAATVSANAPGYRMNLSVSITSPQQGVSISASGNAVVDASDHAASMSLVLQAPQAIQTLGTSTLRMAMVLDGPELYLRFPQALVSQLPNLGGKPWIEENVAKAAGLPGLSSLGGDSSTSDPTQVLGQLRVGADSVTNEGQQIVDGVQTTHYQAEINVDRLIRNVPSSVLKLITPQGQDVPVDVWIDSHDLVRRVDMSLSLGAPNQPSFEETTTADFTDYGPQPRPTPPPANQVTDAGSIAGLSS